MTDRNKHLSASPTPEGGAVDLSDVAICKAAETIRASSVAWANDPAEFSHLIELTPAEIRKLIAALATREEAPACKKCGGKGYTEHEGGEGEGYPSRPEIEACSCRAQPQASSGKVTWHSSGEDEGPDVGLQLDLGHGRSLWLGEGQKPTGWQFSLVHGDDIIPVADVIDHDQARDLFDLIASAVQPSAREDAKPFGYWVEHRSGENPVLIRYGSFVPASDHYKIIALYTHPAPDALREAREAVLSIKDAADSFRDCSGDEVAGQVIIRCDQALAALQAEQGAK